MFSSKLPMELGNESLNDVGRSSSKWKLQSAFPGPGSCFSLTGAGTLDIYSTHPLTSGVRAKGEFFPALGGL